MLCTAERRVRNLKACAPPPSSISYCTFVMVFFSIQPFIGRVFFQFVLE